MHNLSLKLGLSGKVPASGGGVPSSATHFWTPADMTFNGSNELTAITDQVASGSSYIGVTGAPTGNTTDGVAITEATGGANYVSVTGIIPGSYATGTHIAIMFKRNGTGDDRSVVLQAAAASNRYIYARNGAGTASKALMEGDPLRADSTDLTGAYTQDQVWDLLFGDTATRVVLIKDASVDLALYDEFRLLSSATAANNFEGHLMGFSKFTDWADADAVAAALAA